jgi:hypothetical protein
MSDENEQRQDESATAFAKLSEFAQHGSVLATPERIRVLGTRRLQRRRAGQAVLGTGALAAVVFLGVMPAMNASGHDSSPRSLRPAASATASIDSSSQPGGPRCSAATPGKWVLQSSPGNVNANSLVAALRQDCFTHLAYTAKASNTVPAGYLIDIVYAADNQSALGKEVFTDTALIVVASSGPGQ